MINSDYMKLAIQLALQGTGHTSPSLVEHL